MRVISGLVFKLREKMLESLSGSSDLYSLFLFLETNISKETFWLQSIDVTGLFI